MELTVLAIEAVIFDLDGTLAHFNLDYKALRSEVRTYLISIHVPVSVLDVNENIFEMLTEIKWSYLLFFRRDSQQICKVLHFE